MKTTSRAKKQKGDKTVVLEDWQTEGGKEKRAKSAYYPNFTHSDPTYESPVFPAHVQYSGADHYDDIVDAARDIADGLTHTDEAGKLVEFKVIKKQSTDLMSGHKWRLIMLSRTDAEDRAVPLVTLTLSDQPQPRGNIDQCRQMIYDQLAQSL